MSPTGHPEWPLLSEKQRGSLVTLREDFPPEAINQIPKGGRQLDYVGHAWVTDRLLAVDPEWTWEPCGWDEHGVPICERDDQGRPIGLWIKLSVCGMVRLGYGSCTPSKQEAIKELIGDAIRNAAMRFGVALDLWKKDPGGGYEEEESPPRRQSDRARAGRSAGNAGTPTWVQTLVAGGMTESKILGAARKVQAGITDLNELDSENVSVLYERLGLSPTDPTGEKTEDALAAAASQVELPDPAEPAGCEKHPSFDPWCDDCKGLVAATPQDEGTF